MKKEKVGFFGGAFNPPTNIHIYLADSLIRQEILDRVFFVPVGDYYKKDNLVLAKHRYEMLKLACKDYDRIDIENISSSHQELLYAKDSFRLIYDKYKDKFDIYFIMGSDNFIKMPKWEGYKELINTYKFIIIKRPQYSLENTKQDNITYYQPDKYCETSSTQIREMLKQNKNIREWIDKDVLSYIEKNNLYIKT